MLYNLLYELTFQVYFSFNKVAEARFDNQSNYPPACFVMTKHKLSNSFALKTKVVEKTG